AERHKREAQRQAANISVDLDLRELATGDSKLGLLRLARRLESIPPEEAALRECVALNLLTWGQTFAAFLPNPTHDGLTPGALLPSGRSVLSVGGSDNALRIWDALSKPTKPTAVIPNPQTGVFNGGYQQRPDWTMVLTSAKDKGTMDVWELPSGQNRGRLLG